MTLGQWDSLPASTGVRDAYPCLPCLPSVFFLGQMLMEAGEVKSVLMKVQAHFLGTRQRQGLLVWDKKKISDTIVSCPKLFKILLIFFLIQTSDILKTVLTLPATYSHPMASHPLRIKDLASTLVHTQPHLRLRLTA